MSSINNIRPDLLSINKDRKINDEKLNRSIEKISSGLRVNSGADNPSDLYVSERLRAQNASIDQAIQNTEVDISVLQLADSSLSEVNNLLISMRQMAVQAANEAVQDEETLIALQQEYSRAMESLNAITRHTKFGDKHLLDGSSGTSGFTVGDNLEFISAGEKTRLPEKIDGEDVEVIITQNATRSLWIADDEIDEDIAAKGIQLKLFENGRNAVYYTREGDNAESIAQALQSAVVRAGLDVTVTTTDGKLLVLHNQYGSEHSFQVFSNYDDILSDSDNTPNEAIRGADVKGIIAGIQITGKGQVLNGPKNTNLEGLVLRYTGTEGGLEGDSDERSVGKIFLNYGALKFQTGSEPGDTQGISINGYNGDTLGQGIANFNHFKNLNDVDLTKINGGSDAMLLLDDSLNRLNILRTEIGSVQKHGLESKLNTLMVTRENISAAESTIRDTDYAQEISKMLKYSIIQKNQNLLQAQVNKQLYNLEPLLTK